MSQLIDEQVTALEGQGFMKSVVILMHPISGAVTMCFPPLQGADMTVSLMGSTLIAFLAHSRQKCEIYINGKLVPFAVELTPIIKS